MGRGGTKSRDVDIWAEKKGLPTEVSVEGKLVLDTTLRKSTSIRDAYTMYDLPKELNGLFSSVKIGIGSKHIYQQGDFMKKHYDTRLPPVSERGKVYNHIMTLLIVRIDGYSGGDLYVEDKPVVTAGTNGFTAVLFSLNASHEVRPVTKGIRQVIAFPIYGEYNPITSMKKLFQEQTAHKMRDVVLVAIKEELSRVMNNSDKKEEDTDDVTTSEDLRCRVHAYVCALRDDKASKLFEQYRDCYEDSYGTNGNCDPAVEINVETKVSYTLEGETFIEVVKGRFLVPSGATNVVVTQPSMPCQILQNLIKYIEGMKDFTLEDRPTYYKRDISKKQYTTIPETPFIAFLSGRYFSDSTEKDLTIDDKKALDVIRWLGRTVEFIPIARWDSAVGVTGVQYIDGKFVEAVPDSDRVANIDVEFNDNNGYDSSYKLIYGMLVVV